MDIFSLLKKLFKPEPPTKKPAAQTKQPYATIRFQYSDAKGNITERTVDVVTGKKGEAFTAYCHLRKEERKFYFARIHGYQVTDINTGNIITPMEWRYSLQGTKVAKAELERERKEMDRSS